MWSGRTKDVEQRTLMTNRLDEASRTIRGATIPPLVTRIAVTIRTNPERLNNEITSMAFRRVR